MRAATTCAIVLFACALQLLAEVDQLPKLKATTLGGTEVNLPGDTKVGAYVLALGFSHKCDKAVAAWDQRIFPVYSNEPRVAYYEVPVLQGLPGFVDQIVLQEIQRCLPAAGAFTICAGVRGRGRLKKIVGYQDPAAAYLVVATSDGEVAGPLTAHRPTRISLRYRKPCPDCSNESAANSMSACLDNEDGRVPENCPYSAARDQITQIVHSEHYAG